MIVKVPKETDERPVFSGEKSPSFRRTIPQSFCHNQNSPESSSQHEGEIDNSNDKANNNKMNTGIAMIGVGLLIIILASFIKTFLNLLLGIWLIATGIIKLISVSQLHNSDKKTTNIYLIEAVIVIAMGLYSILFQNIILTIIGAWMLIYAGIELYNNLKK